MNDDDQKKGRLAASTDHKETMRLLREEGDRAAAVISGWSERKRASLMYLMEDSNPGQTEPESDGK
jgi:hypothetical protein